MYKNTRAFGGGAGAYKPGERGALFPAKILYGEVCEYSVGFKES